MPRNKRNQQNQFERHQQPQELSKISCLFCQSEDHRSKDCSSVTSVKARTQILEKTGRCLNCFSRNHTTSDCHSKGCFRCNLKHNSSLCPAKQNPKPPTPNFGKKENKFTGTTAAASEESDKKDDEGQVYLLTGQARVKDALSKQSWEVTIAVDTMSSLSYIDSTLAEQLHLGNGTKQTRKLKTFGDDEGTNCEFHKVDLSTKDRKWMKKRQLPLPQGPTEASCKPLLLMGCKELSTILLEKQIKKLPSGLKRTAGHLTISQVAAPIIVSADGRKRLDEDSLTQHQLLEAMKDWDDDEFLGPTKTEQALVDQQVIQAFQENVRIRKGRLEVPLIFNEDCARQPGNGDEKTGEPQEEAQEGSKSVQSVRSLRESTAGMDRQRDHRSSGPLPKTVSKMQTDFELGLLKLSNATKALTEAFTLGTKASAEFEKFCKTPEGMLKKHFGRKVRNAATFAHRTVEDTFKEFKETYRKIPKRCGPRT
ncbi:hypothetical protein L596_000398 [Steinernema carpocapsae]|uniref:CCHC-type domain-containing protein n=1 Tax=Steinernema carpocapsae TaxID=34508 RepID=A0A4U8UM83_STECR|nr:hypothetical protein L596_000398 [Steinernema carpocapsae]